MSQHSTNERSAFGPNEWLVDELYQNYLTDKNSVDKAWWEFFADYSPSEVPHGKPLAGDEAGPDGNGVATPAATPLATTSIPTDASTSTTMSTPRTTPVSTQTTGPATGTASPAASTPAASPAPASPAPASPAPAGTAAGGSPATAPTQVPREASTAPAPRPERAETEVVRLRGPAARVVVNMEASLEVPTATSVRAVPAKLLIDNRVVINNHLARSRGGKVSFTHLIGYALVEALAQLPEMNSAYGEDGDGKPAILRPSHVNLGIAIDLAKEDGSRQLLVPNISTARRWTSASSGRPTRT